MKTVGPTWLNSGACGARPHRFIRASRDCDCGQWSDASRDCGHWSDLGPTPSELQYSLLADRLVVPESATPVRHPQPAARDFCFLLALQCKGRNCGFASFWVQSHNGPVAALQDEIPDPQLRALAKALHLPTVVIRAWPQPELATDQTARVVTVLNDVLD